MIVGCRLPSAAWPKVPTVTPRSSAPSRSRRPCRAAAHRHADVVEQDRALALQGRERHPPGVHQPGALVAVVGAEDVGRAVLVGGLLADRGLLGGGRAVAGHQQDGGRVGSMSMPVISLTAAIVVRSISSIADGVVSAVVATTACTGSRHGGEHRHQRRLLPRVGRSQTVASTTTAERALRADQQPGQVEAGDVLAGRRAGADHGAVGQDGGQRGDVVGGHAVLAAGHAAGVGGDVAADRRDLPAARVGGVAEPVLGGGPAQVPVQHAGLHGRGAPGRVDLEDPVHPLEAEHEAAVGGVRAAGQPGACPAGHDRHAVPGRDPQRRDDVLGAARPDDRQRRAHVGDRALVTAPGEV